MRSSASKETTLLPAADACLCVCVYMYVVHRFAILSGPSGVADWLAYLELDDATFLLRPLFVKQQVCPSPTA